ncbi:peptidylprolyl isomerase [Martiniozyma asiatica (nom. inval.)]|nr:peptidylprolyl isomerase [Martiniozyma asiatica]
MVFVYLDVKIGSVQQGRIVIELTNDAPLASKNFFQLCTQGKYKNTLFHRVIKNFMVQGGDTSVQFNDGDNVNNENDKYPYLNKLGKGGSSIYSNEENLNGYFKSENLIPIEKSFYVCMSQMNGCLDSNSSQFFITCEPSPHLNNKYTVVGMVKYGKSIVRAIERVDVMSNKQSDSVAWIPVESSKVIVENCGEWKENDDIPNYIACTDTVGGDIFEEYPDDNDTEKEEFNFENPEISYNIATIIKGSATILLKEKRLDDSLKKYKKALRYCNELLPDDTNNEEWYQKFQELKKTLFLNISLVCLNLTQYKECIDYCGYILQMENVELTTVQTTKLFYRLGKAYSGLKKYESAMEMLQKGLMVSPDDKIIKTELAAVQKTVSELKKQEKERYTKFFS